ncbi:MAG: hypothetical protein KGJ49_13955 [Alphaproteobacteria bacterium]|nr:hypothetical protein [Alphaproteobacteria bacterium]
MSPFFAKSDGVLLVDPGKTPVYVANDIHDLETLCRLVRDADARRLICGFIPHDACASLQSAGVDVRFGSCAVSIECLLAGFAALPTVQGTELNLRIR